MKKVHHLVRATDPLVADLKGLPAGDILILKENPARIGLELTADHVEKGRLAGPVGTDDCYDLSLPNRQLGVLDGHEPIERFGQTAHLEHGPLPSDTRCSSTAVR